MKKRSIYITKAGGPAVFNISSEEIDENLKDDEVLIEVHYSGINFADIHMRQGLYQAAPAFPFVPGYEVSGKIIKIAPQVDPTLLGQQVMAGTYFGGYSSHVKVSSRFVFPLSEGQDLKHAAATPVSFLTAYFTLFEMARIRQGESIAIDCATGSLGSTMAQLLQNMSVTMTGMTSSVSKKEYMASLGYLPQTHDEFENSNELYDIIVNTRGGASMKKHYNKLKPTGRMVCLGASEIIAAGGRNWFKVLKTVLRMPRFNTIDLMNDNRMVGGLNLLNIFDNVDLITSKMKDLEHFNYIPKVDKVFAADEVSKAHEYIENKQSKGKVLLCWID